MQWVFRTVCRGGANVIDKIKCEHKYGSDIHKELIAFLTALSNGYKPPFHITEEEYKYMKEHQDEFDDVIKGYVGFQLSYGAKWFDTFRRDKIGKRKYDEEAYRNVMKQAPNLQGIVFNCCDFRDIKDIENFVIYCDIPYKNTTSYCKSEVGEFNHEEFYDWVRRNSDKYDIYVSEYKQNIPDDFTIVWEQNSKKDIRNKDNVREETVEVLIKYSK